MIKLERRGIGVMGTMNVILVPQHPRPLTPFRPYNPNSGVAAFSS